MEEKLIAAGIPAALRPYCYISGDGTIFTPQLTDAGELLHTGEELYRFWVDNKGKVPKPVPGELELLRQQVADLQAQVDILTGGAQ